MPTGINYLDEPWSPITGCSGKGCKVRDNCWAKKMVKRFPQLHVPINCKTCKYLNGDICSCSYEPHLNRGRKCGWWRSKIPFSTVQFHPSRLDKPLHWKKPRRVGVCFMGDWLDEYVHSQWIDRMLEIMFRAQQNKYFMLTKQPQRYAQEMKWINATWGGFPECVWHGVSITDQEDADRMIPELLKVPGKHWISMEPMLGHIILDPFWIKCTGATRCDNRRPDHGPTVCNPNPCPPRIGAVILGCESGPKRRPCDPQWMIDVVRQAKAAGVPVWVKQVEVETADKYGFKKHVSHNPEEWPEELRVRET